MGGKEGLLTSHNLRPYIPFHVACWLATLSCRTGNDSAMTTSWQLPPSPVPASTGATVRSLSPPRRRCPTLPKVHTYFLPASPRRRGILGREWQTPHDCRRKKAANCGSTVAGFCELRRPGQPRDSARGTIRFPNISRIRPLVDCLKFAAAAEPPSWEAVDIDIRVISARGLSASGTNLKQPRTSVQ
ncbi:hypothetical protein F4780DRAFT_580574 [Xylariomycetidae sp. FL0641]|nr:hypothetical protein F4780DRAFT_580574 [Xylariomycetidae sp. FL0641]